MTTKERIETIAQNMPLVFEAGKADEYNRFWDSYQQNGERTAYERAFAGVGWNDESFKPKYKVKIVGSAYMAFAGCNISRITRETVDTSKATTFNYAFYYTNGIKEIEIDCSSAQNLNDTFFGGTLTDLTLLNLKNTCVLTNAFKNAALSSVINMTVSGEIGCDLNISTMTGLTADSLLSVISCLFDYSLSGGTHTLTLGSANVAKLSEEQKAMALTKGWTIN